jgi:glutathione-independent formaldehyde dehydrogenase
MSEPGAARQRAKAVRVSAHRPVKRYNRYLRSLIAEDKVKPSWIVSHDLPLDQAPEAYKHFDAREEGWTKVVLHPGQAA